MAAQPPITDADECYPPSKPIPGFPPPGYRD
jgi:hypothetical protein